MVECLKKSCFILQILSKNLRNDGLNKLEGGIRLEIIHTRRFELCQAPAPFEIGHRLSTKEASHRSVILPSGYASTSGKS